MSTDAPQMPAERTHSLNTVRESIPDSCYERPAAPAVRALIKAFVVYGATIVGLYFAHSWWSVALMWIAAGLAVSGLFVLGHDASHGALTSSNRANRLLAQICMAPSVHVEAAWDLGHNRIHHGYTTRQGFDFVWHPTTVDEWKSMGKFARLRHRLEWSFLGSGAYFGRTVWWQKMWRYNGNDKRRGDIIRDLSTLTAAMVVAVAITATLGAMTGGVATAFWLPIKLLVVPFLLFLQSIGWIVYVHHVAPDIRWWPKKEWTQYKGQMESTTVIETPAIVNWLWFHNILVHVPHHVDVRIPFHQLPQAARAIEAAYPHTVRRSKISLRSYLRATKACKLYDFEAGTWLPYSAAA
jgi:omega-6 fatty acid desaturase (delta-12 desaturase)